MATMASETGTSYGLPVQRIEPHPDANYAPWLRDRDYIVAFQTMVGATTTAVDPYRCYELWQLVGQTASTPGDLLEVGVWRGGSGVLIAESCRAHGIDAPIWLCDTFEGIPKAGEEDPYYTGGEFADTDAATVQGIFEELEANVTVVQGVFPDESGDSVPAEAIRFCHVDVDVFESARDTTDWVWPRLSVGGVIVYDDFGFPSCAGVTRYVEEQRSLPDRVVIHNLNGHGIVVKTR